MLGKKGVIEDMLYFMIMEVIFLAAIIGGMFWYVNANADGTIFWKNYYAKDFAITIDAASSLPADLQILYAKLDQTHDFEFSIDNDKISIYEIPRDRYPSTYYFAISKFVSITPASLTTDFFIKKHQNDITFFSEQPVVDLDACANIDTKDDYSTQLYAFEEYDPASSSKAYPAGITNSLQYYFRSENIQVLDNYEADQASLAILIDEDTSSENLQVVYNSASPKSKKLACLVAKHLQQYFSSSNTQKVYVDQDFSVNDPKTWLRLEPSVIIVVGSKNNPSQANLVPSIVDSIKEYYG